MPSGGLVCVRVKWNAQQRVLRGPAEHRECHVFVCGAGAQRCVSGGSRPPLGLYNLCRTLCSDLKESAAGPGLTRAGLALALL